MMKKGIFLRTSWAGVGILVLSLVWIQAQWLDRSIEMTEEASAVTFHKLPAEDLIATYVASLFLGPFRPIFTDMLWLELEKAEEEKRIFRIKELLEWLIVLQPRSEEARALLAWDMNFNIAATVGADRRWSWEREGLMFMRKSVDDLPRSPYMTWELAQTHLMKKSYPADGTFNRRYIENVMGDPVLQERIRPRGGANPQIPFESAIGWMEKTRDRLREFPNMQTRTPGGVLLHARFAERFIGDMMYVQAMWHRERGEYDKARSWLERAREATIRYKENYDIPLPKFADDLISFFESMRGLMELEARKPGDARLLKAYDRLLKKYPGNLDQRFIYDSATEIKIRLTGDENEYNDRPMDATPLEPERPIEANLWPSGDIDIYELTMTSHRVGRRKVFEPRTVDLVVEGIRLDGVQMTVTVRPLEREGKGRAMDLFLKKGTSRFPIRIAEPAVLQVRLSSPRPGGDRASSAYRLRVSLSR